MSTPTPTGQPTPGYAPQPGPPNQGYTAPNPGYGPPNQGQAQAPQYGPPANQAPAPNYGPPPGYAPQQQGYAPQQPGYAPQQQVPGSAGPAGPSGPNPFPQAKATFSAAVHSEWTKIRTVRSTFWTLLVTMVITIGLSALFAIAASQNHDGKDLADSDWPANALSGLFLGQLVIVVFGAMALTAEYSTGMIRTSLTSQPRRGTLFWAKTLIVALVSVTVGLICSFTSFFIASAVYSGHDVHISLSDGDTLRAVFGGGLYLAVSALLAFGLGAILRHTAGAITTAVGLLFVLWILVAFLPGTWRADIAKWVPFNAGMQIITTRPTEDMLAPWTGFGVFTAYAAVAVILGAIVMRNKDA